MFKLDDKDKSAKEKVLQEIMDLMDTHSGSKLKDLKKPAVMEMSVSKLGPEDAADGGADDDKEGDEGPMAGFGKSWDPPPGGTDDGDEPSDAEKAQIASLYAKYCK